MATSTEKGIAGSLDWLKWLVVVALLAGGVYGNWYYQDESLLVRVVALITLAIVSALIAVQTERGRGIWSLMKEARIEVRRVVWPTNQETTQTTLVVIVLVFIFALILWGLDSLLGWAISSIIG
ncbi:MAG: preprotein translocase subunit SecE [Gammaproteobacteria bacterium TMED134]|nr:MAG: preprotein translocase subunit SecE [Gammaproteobacteria bacterium TMED134]HBK19140.1 preprotein translocase subunit SecE [Gammaproteobacteria bacterium]